MGCCRYAFVVVWYTSTFSSSAVVPIVCIAHFRSMANFFFYSRVFLRIVRRCVCVRAHYMRARRVMSIWSPLRPFSQSHKYRASEHVFITTSNAVCHIRTIIEMAHWGNLSRLHFASSTQSRCRSDDKRPKWHGIFLPFLFFFSGKYTFLHARSKKIEEYEIAWFLVHNLMVVA